jgi:ACS family tartrate transporter-like MFS transporter
MFVDSILRKNIMSNFSDKEVSRKSVGEEARKRIASRILPYVFILYIIAFLDRVNVGYAALEMTKSLKFTPEAYGFGAGIFFFGYFLLEVPGSVLVEKWSAKGWIARIMISWGILAILTGFIQTTTHFYIIRFLLGAAEAGFFPGIVVYLNHWFINEDKAKAMSRFMAAVPVASIIGSPMSGVLLGIKWLGLEGWRWLFILEGAPAVLLGIITLFYLTDKPEQANWLSTEQRDWIISELQKEKEVKLKNPSSYNVWSALKHPNTILLALSYFLILSSGYGLNFWLPIMVKKISGFPNMLVTLVAALPYCVGLVTMLVVGWSSDRSGERYWHAAVPMIVCSIGLFLGANLQGNIGIAIIMFSIATAGIMGFLPGFWALPSAFLTGSAAAVAIGLINSIGSLGGFLGPYIVGYLNNKTKSFVASIIYLSVSALLAAILVLSVRKRYKYSDLEE